MDKQSLRKIYLNKRSLLSEKDVAALSKEISSNFFNHIDLQNLSSLHLFLPIKHRSEINTWFIIEELKSRYPGIKIVVPKLNGDNLLSYLIDSNTRFEENNWGIPEPVNGEEYPAALLDMVLVPLLAFDKSGNRIGYGKGFYDRFLLQCKPDVIKVGFSFFNPEEKINAELFDIPLDFCITPSEVYSF